MISSAFAGVYRDKTVWLSGHTGFKGSWLASWLLELGAKVHGFSLPPSTNPALFEQLGLAQRLDHEVGDVRDMGVVAKSIASVQPDFVFHLAAQPLVRLSYEQPVDTYATNVMGTAHVLDALRGLNKPCAVVFITTDKCYENREWIYGYREDDPLGGHDPYSSSKAAAEIAIASFRRSFFQDHPVRVASARAGNVIGGGDWAQDRIVPDCIRALQEGLPIPVRNKIATRPWQHMLEPLSGYLWLAASLWNEKSDVRCQKSGTNIQEPVQTSDLSPGCSARRAGSRPLPSVLRPQSSALASAFNFGPTHESNRTVGELVTEVLKHWPGRWEDKSDPKAPHEAGLLQLSIDKAHALLRWSPVWNFAIAVEQTVRWYRATSEKPDPVFARQLTSAQIWAYTAKAREAGVPWVLSAL